MRVQNQDLLEIDGSRATVSLAANANLKPIWMGHVINASIQLVFTGTPDGSFKLQVSNDPGSMHSASEAQQYAGLTNWTDVADSSQTISAAGNLAYELQNNGFEWVRVVWTASTAGSGTPTLTVARSKIKGL